MQPTTGDISDPGNGQGPRAAGQVSPSPRIYGNAESELAAAQPPGVPGNVGASSSNVKPRPKASFSEIVESLNDPVELASLVKLESCDQIEAGKFTVEQVVDTIAWALALDANAARSDEVNRMVKSPALKQQSPEPKLTGRKMYRSLCVVLAILLVLFCAYLGISVAVNALTQEVSVDQNGVLLGPADDGESDVVVTTGSAVVLHPLLSYPSLAASELGRVKDAVFVHKDTWHCVRIARVVKYSNHHVVLHSHDGSKIRVREGKAYFRNKHEAWEPIDMAESEKYASMLSDHEARWLLKGAFATDTLPAPVGYSVAPLGLS